MDRLSISGNVPAEIAELASDCLPETTEAEEQEAVDSIIDDYLLCGQMYPARGGRLVATTGEYLQLVLDEEDIESLLTAIVNRDTERLSDKATDLIALCREGLPAWLRKNKAYLIERRVEELQPDEDES
jgi:hypothetical protein